MMTGYVTDAAGKRWRLPPLLRWELRRTGGIPCDSFCVSCAWDADTMPPVMEHAARFALRRGTALCLAGVIDEYSVELGTQGGVLTLSGRGLAALLLDNEAEAVSYQRATAEELLQRHAAPYGLRCEACGAAAGAYTVRGGTSEWKALDGFAQLCGLRLWLSREGRLSLRGSGAGRTVRLSGRPLALKWRDRRYGVLSEVTVIDGKSGTRRSVRSETLSALGAQCRRVGYVPAQSTVAARLDDAAQQLAQSAAQRFCLTAELAGYLDVDALDRVELAEPRLGLAGAFLVEEAVWRGGADGERTVLTLRKE